MATRRTLTVLTKIAAVLSLGSLIWTTWSLFDLLGAGWAGITVAGCADAVWGSVIYAEYRGVRVAGRRWPVIAFGWTALIAVAAFLVWHGLSDNNLAMAIAGPFLPIGAKAVWVLALADMRDPAALTDAENAALAAMERGLIFEEAQHAKEMRRRTMQAELLMAEVSTDFDIEVMRQDRARQLHRTRPMEMLVIQQTTPTSDAPGEAADQTGDAPLQRAALSPAAAPRRTVDAPQQDSADALMLEGLSKADAVRTIRDAYPAASAPQIVERLAHHGIETDAPYVRTVLSRARQQRIKGNGGYM